MSRFKTYEALVLRTRPLGESNREAWFLTGEAGLVRAVVYGGPKSKLRSFVSPFHSGLLYLYHDPVRDSCKVTDFDVRSWRPGIREKYERTICGGALSETILAGHGGGSNWQDALVLADTTLDALQNADELATSRIFVYFLWQWTEILGVKPDPETSLVSGRNPAALHWLKQIENIQPSMLACFSLDDAALNYAKSMCIEILAQAFGKKLTSWSAL